MTTRERAPISEPFTLEQIDTTLIPSGNRSDGTASTWSDIWKFQIPAGQGITIMSGGQISFYLEDGSGEVGNNTCRVRISIADTSENDGRVIWGPQPYINLKEFADRRKVARFQLAAPVPIYEEQFLKIQVYDDGAIDESDSTFMIELVRTRQGL